jgi:hypothetical protein
MNKRITLPKPVADIYRAVAELERSYPGRHFTLDGHLVGSIGEVIAREAFGFELSPAGRQGHDAICKKRGHVQIKITAGNSIALRGPCENLLVLRIALWEKAGGGRTAANGQRRLSLSKLKELTAAIAARGPRRPAGGGRARASRRGRARASAARRRRASTTR